MPDPRRSDHPIEPLFLARWSPRAFDAEPMPDTALLSILEAGRWAPSANNLQPWRFLYARRGEAHWPDFLSALNAFNRDWAQNASALIILLSDTIAPGSGGRPDAPARYNSFDAGSAWMQMALQATAMGYAAHAMAGLDFDAARRALAVPPRFKIEVGVAIGRRADPGALPDRLRERETPSGRAPLDQIAFAGPFPQAAAA